MYNCFKRLFYVVTLSIFMSLISTRSIAQQEGKTTVLDNSDALELPSKKITYALEQVVIDFSKIQTCDIRYVPSASERGYACFFKFSLRRSEFLEIIKVVYPKAQDRIYISVFQEDNSLNVMLMLVDYDYPSFPLIDRARNRMIHQLLNKNNMVTITYAYID